MGSESGIEDWGLRLRIVIGIEIGKEIYNYMIVCEDAGLVRNYSINNFHFDIDSWKILLDCVLGLFVGYWVAGLLKN